MKNRTIANKLKCTIEILRPIRLVNPTETDIARYFDRHPKLGVWDEVMYSAVSCDKVDIREIHMFRKKMSDKEKRNFLDLLRKVHKREISILEDFSYPKALIGYRFVDNDNIQIVYHMDTMIEDIMDQSGWSYQDAEDWYSENTLKGCPYCYGKDMPAPDIIYYDEELNMEKTRIAVLDAMEKERQETGLDETIEQE